MAYTLRREELDLTHVYANSAVRGLLMCRNPRYIYSHAASYGSLRVLKWMAGLDGDIGRNHGSLIWYNALDQNHLRVMKFCKRMNFDVPFDFDSLLVRNGDLTSLSWAHSVGLLTHYWLCQRAALAGQLHVLQWIRGIGIEWDAMTCVAAARHGHLHIIQWARANGCPWDNETPEAAVEGGHLETLKWVMANGCYWNRNMCLAMASRYPHIREYILELRSDT